MTTDPSRKINQLPAEHPYRNHLIMTKHIPGTLPLDVDGAQVIGAKLIRPYPEARIFSMDHINGYFYIYWIDDRLTRARGWKPNAVS